MRKLIVSESITLDGVILLETTACPSGVVGLRYEREV
jgi:hypothetical protein